MNPHPNSVKSGQMETANKSTIQNAITGIEKASEILHKWSSSLMFRSKGLNTLYNLKESVNFFL